MRGKLLFVAGAAVGYVLGARAGRKRYEQIKAAATRVWETPGIQRQVNAAEDYAAEKFGEIPGALFEGAKKVVTQVVNRAQAAQKQGSGHRPSAPVPTTTPYAQSPSRAAAATNTSTVTIAAPPDEETATAPTTAPKASPRVSSAKAPSTKASSKGGAGSSTKRKAAASSPEIDEADDAGA
jgi:hypothetical protein